MEELSPDKTAKLEFDHNVIEHLGIRLYQNRISNVIAELVANSWDADSREVQVDTSANKAGDPFISVADDGLGMDYKTITSRYLVIGKKKRSSPKDKSLAGRLPMGRKGIGKLAPFGISRRVDVVTIHSAQVNWFSMDLSRLVGGNSEHLEYFPPFYLRNKSIKDIGNLSDSDVPSEIAAFISHRQKAMTPQGTLILMRSLTPNAMLLDTQIVSGLVDKFTVTLARNDFKVNVNGSPIEMEKALPAFEMRIPTKPGSYDTEKVDGHDVKFWAGFVGAASWPSDQAGVGVFVHGKIGQDRPFYFGSKGKEIFQRYLYAVIEADWLDELDHDLISTDRTSINWDDPAAEPLREWGRKKVADWLQKYSDHRASRHLSEVHSAASGMRDRGDVPSFSRSENDAVEALVADATKEIGKGAAAETTRNELISAVSKAWINLPTRKLLSGLWGEMSKTQNNPDSFRAVTEKLNEQSVPEAMGLAMTFAQRAYALSVLTELIARDSETDLQKLVEDFPWILQPRGEKLTANQWLKTTMERLATAKPSDENERFGRVIQGMTEKERADFVFLTDSDRRRIEIVEIKGPAVELTQAFRRQLQDYIDYVERTHSTAVVTGLLIGRMPSPRINTHDDRIRATSWNDILLECRAAYIDLLAAMLERADPDPGDARVPLVQQFGGEHVWQLLRNLSKSDERLRRIMAKFDPLIEAAAPESAEVSEATENVESLH